MVDSAWSFGPSSYYVGMEWLYQHEKRPGLAPAKINLFLAVTGQRSDGFHDLLSLVSPIDFCDELSVSYLGKGIDNHLQVTGQDGLATDDNLVMRAAQLFLQRVGASDGFAFVLTKNIPVGAGLGGGSSDAVTTLRVLNEGYGSPLTREELLPLAAELGSDCSLFLHEGATVLRGRGELVAEASLPLAWQGKRVVLFRPEFAVNTAWAYGQMAEQTGCYLANAKAEEALAALWQAKAVGGDGLYNSFESVVGRKFLAIPTLLNMIREDLQIPALMSGSGSVCFALVQDEAQGQQVRDLVQDCWGEDANLGVFNWR